MRRLHLQFRPKTLAMNIQGLGEKNTQEHYSNLFSYSGLKTHAHTHPHTLTLKTHTHTHTHTHPYTHLHTRKRSYTHTHKRVYQQASKLKQEQAPILYTKCSCGMSRVGLSHMRLQLFPSNSAISWGQIETH